MTLFYFFVFAEKCMDRFAIKHADRATVESLSPENGLKIRFYLKRAEWVRNMSVEDLYPLQLE